MGPAWYVLQTKPKKERQVCSYVESQGFEVFYPAVVVTPVNPRSSTIRPLFPRYMFVRADLERVGMSALQWVPASIGLVRFGEQPAAVPDAVIYQIKRRVAEIQHAGGLNLDGIKCGDPVRITQGPLAGYAALFDMRLRGSDRVQVLLDMLGRMVRAQVDASAIEKKTR